MQKALRLSKKQNTRGGGWGGDDASLLKLHNEVQSINPLNKPSNTLHQANNTPTVQSLCKKQFDIVTKRP
jgi:hypothetical protein